MLVVSAVRALLPPLCSRGSHRVRMPSMDFGAWGGSTEEAVRARYAETAQIRAQQPRSSTIAWIVSDGAAASAPFSLAASAAFARPKLCSDTKTGCTAPGWLPEA